MNNIINIAAVLICILLWMSPALSHDHLKTDYVPWGMDEYELFGLTKGELVKDFKNKIQFNKELTEACLTTKSYNAESYGPRFLITYANGHVSSVQRMFIDGCGCHIIGPILKSKTDALKFSINGLAALPGKGDKQDHQRLLSAMKMLHNIEHPSTPKNSVR